MTTAFLIIERPDHTSADERRVVTSWLKTEHALSLRSAMLERAAQTGTYVEVTVQHQVDCRKGRSNG